MRTPPADLADRQVADAAARWWRLRADRLRYLPVGGGSHHWAAELADGTRYFLTVDDLLAKPWLGADPESAFTGLCAAFATAVALRARSGLPFVAAPVPAVSGQTACRVTARYSLAVFPFIEGQAGEWGSFLAPPDRDRLARLLAGLHLATPDVRDVARHRGMRLDDRSGLEDALDDLGRSWTAGPFGEPARRLLTAHAAKIRTWLASHDDLVRQVAADPPGDVVTHGEPHPGNLLTTAVQVCLVDWDTVALAPPERDLWMLDDGSPDAFRAYTRATGRTVTQAALRAYRLGWALADVAAFTIRLRSGHDRDRDAEHALAGLTTLLSAGQSASPGPYRFAR